MSSPTASVMPPSSVREQPKAPSSKPNFPDIPTEIRNRIYQHVFEDACIKYEEQYELNQPISTSQGYEILLAAKVCYQEAKVMFYKNASVWMYDPWRKKTTRGMFTTNILQYVEEITLRTETGWYCLPEVFKEMKSLKRVQIDHPYDYQDANPEDGVYVKDEELCERFEGYFNPKPAGTISKPVMAHFANKLEITIPVTFFIEGAHAREIVRTQLTVLQQS